MSKSAIFKYDESFGPYHEVYRGIHFRLIDVEADVPVCCLVSTEALHDKAVANGLDENAVLKTFLEFRGEISGLAADKYFHGQSHPLVTSADLNPS